MHKVLGAGALLLTLTGAAQAQEAMELDGIGVSRDVSCKGRDVIITGNANEFRLDGDCGRVDVQGSEHVLRLGSAASLEVTGAENRVDVGHIGGLAVNGSGHRINAEIRGEGQSPTVAIYGAENILQLDLEGPVSIEVNGIGQQVAWEGEEPEISTSGTDHRIERK
ncbi:DUF3060 domain-containing protein [Pseudomonas sp. PDM15]|uniref:DUF3060 domain-containing protein n=1 Tax=Pseudomonas sp. PDM15 TaxID=2769303 RepID=UPI0017824CC4|nr:DUF3060 domain-containing protein [Pseudomonas sp. PDM15]MBD9426065.1 DUF3060 domain-containing protein [Pseudomonas sp. PDM15]